MAGARMRSLMFVPAHRRRMVERALGLAAFAPTALDAAILDLEDGVPLGEKDAARTGVRDVLASAPGQGTTRLVRVNPPDTALFDADARALAGLSCDGVVVPKVASPAELDLVRRRMGDVALIASIESARGLLAAPAIANAPGVVALLFGAEDYALDLGLPAQRAGEAAELTHARASVVVAAVAAGRVAIDGIWPDLSDTAGLREDALRARRLGFVGKSLIHPSQIETINETFSPSPAEIAHARRVVAAFDDATKNGKAAVALDGQLVDPPIVERARRTLELAERAPR